MNMTCSLQRGLSCLAAINKGAGLTVAECAVSVDLPRTTTFRLLETLRTLGYIRRDPDGRYHLTPFVHTLSSGLEDERWITDVAYPELKRLSGELMWSTGLITASGLYMDVRSTTDLDSPLSLTRLPPRSRMPIIRSCAGLTYLSTLSEAAAADRIAASLAEVRAQQDEAREVEASVAFARRHGYLKRRYGDREDILSVPFSRGGVPVGACGIKFISSAVTDAEVHHTLLPALRRSAQLLAEPPRMHAG